MSASNVSLYCGRLKQSGPDEKLEEMGQEPRNAKVVLVEQDTDKATVGLHDKEGVFLEEEDEEPLDDGSGEHQGQLERRKKAGSDFLFSSLDDESDILQVRVSDKGSMPQCVMSQHMAL